ncbi:MAG: hypothetical protein ACI4IT_05395, partial [Oscillospiraceae bacterium]
AKPTYNDLKSLLEVEIDCDTESEEDEDEDKHPKITYDLLNNTEGSYDSFSVTQSDRFGYQYTVIVYSARYIQAYSDEELNGEKFGPHSPEDDDDISETVILEYKLVNTGSSWKPKWEMKWCLADDEEGKIDFEVVCNGTPTPPTVPADNDLSAIFGNNKAVRVRCTNSEADHAYESYNLIADSYVIADKVGGDAKTGYTCNITVYPSAYVTQYNVDKGSVEHTLDPNTQVSATIILEHNGESWQFDGTPVTFYVKCVTPDPVWSGLSISKTSNAENGKVVPGATITYTIKVKNETGRDLSDITVSEKLDANLTLESATTTSGAYNSANNEWTISSLNNGAEATLTINATVANGLRHGTKIGNEAVIMAAKAGDKSLPRDVILNGRCDVDVYNPVVTAIEKEVVTSQPTDLTNVLTGITYPNANNIATVDYGTTSVTLLYKVTVSGDVGASYSVTDEGATCISNPSNGTIPTGGEAVLYFTKTFNLVNGNKCNNTASVDNPNLSANAAEVTVEVSAPAKPSEEYLERLLANGAVKIDCTNTKVNHADKTYGLLEGSYEIGEPQKVEGTDVYTCEITVYAAPYVAQYSDDMRKEHTLSDNSPKTITLIYNDDQGWYVGRPERATAPAFTGVTFNVVCEETPATTYTVTYKDGVGGKVFKDDVHTVESGTTTPAFVGGIPTRPGYVFVGWTPAVSKTVTGDATYTATWRKVKDTTVIEIGGGNSSSSSSKEENPNTGAPVFVGVSVGALAAAK